MIKDKTHDIENTKNIIVISERLKTLASVQTHLEAISELKSRASCFYSNAIFPEAPITCIPMNEVLVILLKPLCTAQSAGGK